MTGDTGTTRRSVLLGAVALGSAGLTAGCTTAEQDPPPPPDPDDALRREAAARERDLLAAYDAALLADPTLAPRLLPLRAHHERHLAEVTAPLPVPSPSGTSPGATPSPAATPPPGAPPPVTPPPVTAPGPVTPSLVTLAEAERVAGTAHALGALQARDRGLAGLLASLSASEQSHPVALG